MKKQKVNIKLNKLIPLAEELLAQETPLLGVVAAGFPSEAFNYTEEGIDFNKLLVKQRETTFCLVAGGDSMRGDGIFKGDLLVIDKLEEPYDNSIVVFSINGEFTLKRLNYRNGYVELVSSNPEMESIIVREGEELKRWGVLKFAIKRF
ncbi:MAG: S24 family peptidase [Dysgonamonadaceae bacterium]|jgi:DNA polymerase V|nr:S24 family peptidase [Dysgonamonadaceae bacterium]